MDTLLLQLAGPLQSWGVQSLYSNRDSGREPSKSGVIGLLCAALGRDRAAPLEDLAALRMGVRVDREGRLMQDFHTAQTVAVNGEVKGNAEISVRYYLADAVFLVGLEGSRATLEGLHYALRHPHWGLFLGRKAFPPGRRVWLPDGLREDEPLEDALTRYPWLGRSPRETTPTEQLRMVIEHPQGEQARADVPISFAERRFSSRRVHTNFIPIPEGSQNVSIPTDA